MYSRDVTITILVSPNWIGALLSFFALALLFAFGLIGITLTYILCYFCMVKHNTTQPSRGDMKESINLADFQKLDIRSGTIIDAKINKKAKKPAYALRIDFGDELGEKDSSAQLTQNYQVSNLIGKQILAVVNFPPLRVAGIKSEVLVLACVGDEATGTVLVQPDFIIPNGTLLA